MNDDAPKERTEQAELPAIDFHSRRFAVHNPPPDLPEPEAWVAAPFHLDGMSNCNDSTSRLKYASTPWPCCSRRPVPCASTALTEPWLYHHSSIQQACTRLLLAHPRNQLRILVADPTRAVKEGHRLLQLARRLTSNVHIRKLHPDYPEPNGTYLLADDCGLLERPRPTSMLATPCIVTLLACAYAAEFDKAWDHGQSDANLRSFLL